MTIAVCYLSADGVVFGADSTTTMYVPGHGQGSPGSYHHYNYAQKVFQLGESGTLALVMWGLGNLPSTSYRTLIATFADELLNAVPATVSEVAIRWSSLFWKVYAKDYAEEIEKCRLLGEKKNRTVQEDEDYLTLKRTATGGFCIGGRLTDDRTPSAFEIVYNLSGHDPISPKQLALGTTRYWGCPNLMERLITGADLGFVSSINQSGKWSGSMADLLAILKPFSLSQPSDLPIREAIDWVHASIYTTIKVMKFSHLSPVCGGPIEVAVITTDRAFRWVRHKSLDAAICEGGI